MPMLYNQVVNTGIDIPTQLDTLLRANHQPTQLVLTYCIKKVSTIFIMA